MEMISSRLSLKWHANITKFANFQVKKQQKVPKMAFSKKI